MLFMDYEWLHKEGLPPEYRSHREPHCQRDAMHQFVIDRSIYDALKDGIKMKKPHGPQDSRSVKTLVDSGVKIRTATYRNDAGDNITAAVKRQLPKDWKKRMIQAGYECRCEEWLILQFNFNRYEWNNLLYEDQEFSDTYAKYRNALKCAYEKLGLDLCTGESKGSAAAWRFFMANKFGWAEKTEQTVQQSITSAAKDASQLTDEELNEEIAARGLPASIFEEL